MGSLMVALSGITARVTGQQVSVPPQLDHHTPADFAATSCLSYLSYFSNAKSSHAAFVQQ